MYVSVPLTELCIIGLMAIMHCSYRKLMRLQSVDILYVTDTVCVSVFVVGVEAQGGI